MLPNTDIDVLLSRYLWGECLPEEQAAVEAWIAEREDRRVLVAKLRAALGAVERVPLAPLDFPVFEQRLAQRLHGATTSAATQRRSRWGGIAGLTAMATAAAVVAIALFSRARMHVGETGVQVTNVAFGTSHATTVAQKATLTLIDGTRVTLGPQSKLCVAKDYPATRAVLLEGEAQFDVAHVGVTHAGVDASAPFIVSTNTGVVRVLGTVFSVRSLPHARQGQVVVTSGRVSVTGSSRAVVLGAVPGGASRAIALAAGDAAEMSDSLVRAIDVDSLEQFTAWSTGQLHFHRAPVEDVLATLTRWYGYQFRIADSTLVQHNLTAVLDASSLKNALNTLKLLLNVDLVFTDKTVTLQPRATRAVRHDQRNPRNDFSTPNNEVGR